MADRPQPARAARPAVLGRNQYGKAETRVVKVTRDGDTHHVRDLNVSVALAGDMDEVHYSGTNTHVLPTDTTKNTVYAFAKRYGIESPEAFAVHLARHFTGTQEPIHRARIRVEEYAWERIDAPARHSFVRGGRETRVAQVTYDGERFEVLGGLKDLVVMNTTASEFWGYAKDAYTTLQEDYDRILATEVSAWWRHRWTGIAGAGAEPPAWDESYEQTAKHLLTAFADTYSLSLQQSLYAMGTRVVEHRPEIEEIRFSLPNKHHFRVDLEPFGLKNDAADGAVYFAADRPYGLIEATVLRAGADARIPDDMTNL
ncbi:urate oxidase [Streptomyces sp. NBC_01808]|uniref:factor-independent urate hydroxylase n=1 Tax=Streptomyces sp. NBC_01808 TaxID=2975947 RepID=UPI002DD9AEAB|nr:urate oxidase [Streptomyces sp. NBC_01808]WSA41384.1 urate oxidase [Streptomyces sp. NBC_01808]